MDITADSMLEEERRKKFADEQQRMAEVLATAGGLGASFAQGFVEGMAGKEAVSERNQPVSQSSEAVVQSEPVERSTQSPVKQPATVTGSGPATKQKTLGENIISGAKSITVKDVIGISKGIAWEVAKTTAIAAVGGPVAVGLYSAWKAKDAVKNLASTVSQKADELKDGDIAASKGAVIKAMLAEPKTWMQIGGLVAKATTGVAGVAIDETLQIGETLIPSVANAELLSQVPEFAPPIIEPTVVVEEATPVPPIEVEKTESAARDVASPAPAHVPAAGVPTGNFELPEGAVLKYAEGDVPFSNSVPDAGERVPEQHNPAGLRTGFGPTITTEIESPNHAMDEFKVDTTAPDQQWHNERYERMAGVALDEAASDLQEAKAAGDATAVENAEGVLAEKTGEFNLAEDRLENNWTPPPEPEEVLLPRQDYDLVMSTLSGLMSGEISREEAIATLELDSDEIEKLGGIVGASTALMDTEAMFNELTPELQDTLYNDPEMMQRWEDIKADPSIDNAEGLKTIIEDFKVEQGVAEPQVDEPTTSDAINGLGNDVKQLAAGLMQQTDVASAADSSVKNVVMSAVQNNGPTSGRG